MIINPRYKIGDNVCNYEMLPNMLDYRIHIVLDINPGNGGRCINYRLENNYWYPDICLLPCPLFKVGQKVLIDPDLPKSGTPESYQVPFVVDGMMDSFIGKTATITYVKQGAYEPDKPFEDGCLYHLDIDNGKYNWSSQMFNLKIYDNENQLQGEESVNRRRGNREGSIVCCRRFEAAVAIGHLSHQTYVRCQED